MPSLIKCASCGKKPGVKSNGERAAWSGVSKGPVDALDMPHDVEVLSRACAKVTNQAAQRQAAEADAKKVAAAFRQFDKNGDGVVSRDELREVLLALVARGAKPLMSEKDVDTLLGTVDVNGDGLIDYEEFTTWVSSPGDGKALLEGMRGSQSANRVMGPERFFYDKSSYTGTHVRGGPERVAKGAGTSSNQTWKRPTSGVGKRLPDLDVRERAHDRPSSGCRSQSVPRLTSMPAPSTAVAVQVVTPSRSSAPWSTEPTDASPQPPSRHMTPTRGSASPQPPSRPMTPLRAGTALSRPKTPLRSVSTPSGARVRAEAAEQGAAPKDSKRLVGPERFFYDKSSYTGTHAKGGPESVPKGMGTSVDQTWKRDH